MKKSTYFNHLWPNRFSGNKAPSQHKYESDLSGKAKVFALVLFAFASIVLLISVNSPVAAAEARLKEETVTDVSGTLFEITRIDTNPVVIQGLKDLDALQDGIYTEDAVVHQVDMNTGIIVEFSEPVTLSGFVAAVGGTYGNPSGYVWSIAKADSWADMTSGSGSFELIVPATLMTDSGVVNLPFGADHTAKVFQISGDRVVGDGFVSYQEVAPVLAGQIPPVYQTIQANPGGLSANDPYRLFDGRIDPFAFINPNAGTPLEIVIDYGNCQATWTEIRGYAGGNPANPNEYQWTLEMADTMSDLTSQTGSYQLLLNEEPTPGDTWWVNGLGGEYQSRLFRLTVLRSGDNWEHVAEFTPKVKDLVCSYSVFLPFITAASN